MSLQPLWRLFAAGALAVALAGLAGFGTVFFLMRGRAPVDRPPPAPAPLPAAQASPPAPDVAAQAPLQPPAAAAQTPGGQALARRADDILRADCHRCHGKDGAMEGGFNYILDRSRLVARKKIVPGRPDQSALLRRIVDQEMPPEDATPRPGPEDVAVLRQWIDAGAPDFGSPPPERPAVAVADLPRSIGDDLAALPQRDRRFARYFTLAPLRNAGLAEDELETYRQAVAKLLNSLSWGREIAAPHPVDPEKTLLRIDLRDVKWTDATWDRLTSDYPYGGEADRAVADAVSCRVPCVRADWFTAAVSRPPLYYDLLKMPQTDHELEALLQVEAAEDIRAERVVRAGFADSGVSRHNRVIERHESGYGAYWKSYDFGDGAGAKNIFAHPLGPTNAAEAFQPDGGEIIFDLPNGLHGYFLTDGGGKRLDQAQVAIVSDPKRPELAVVAGLSCMSCHARGLNDKADQIRDHVEKNPGAFPKDETASVFALYPPHDRFAALLRGDNDRYRTALEKTGGRTDRSDPVAALTARFEADLDLAQAAAEAGVRPPELAAAIAAAPALGRTLGALRTEGGAVPRRQFVDSFGDLMRALRPGEAFRPAGPPVVETAVKERAAVDLPEGFEQVKTGGGGRFLIFHLKKAKKLAIFDVFQAGVVHEIEVPDDIRFAAGRDKLLLALPGQKVIQRYDLHTFAREKTAPVPGGGGVLTAVMGSDSQGPLGLWCGGPLILVDVDRMAPVKVEDNSLGGSTQWGFELRVSADGQTFVGWNPGLSPTDFVVMHLAGKKATTGKTDAGWMNERWATPNADGGLLVRFDSHLLTSDLRAIPSDSFAGWMLLPTEDPRFFLAARGQEVAVCTTADCRPVFTLKDPALEGMDHSSMSPRWFNFRGEPRVRYLPQANLMVFLREDNKQITVRPFDLAGELDKAGENYLFVLSPPLTRARAGKAYSYRIEVRSKMGGLTYRLESGPQGMTVSGSGEVRWDVPASQAGKTAAVVVSVRDAAGKEVIHSFEVTVD